MSGKPLMGEGHTDRSLRVPALLVATMANFLTPFMGSSVNIALPTIGREFAADAIVLGWIPTSFLLAAAMFAVPLRQDRRHLRPEADLQLRDPPVHGVLPPLRPCPHGGGPPHLQGRSRGSPAG